MSARKATQGWAWPIDVQRFDCTPALNKTERKQLRAITCLTDCKRDTVVKAARAGLGRLVAPLDAALEVICQRTDRRNRVIYHLLLEMQRRQSTFWAWTPQDWLEIFGLLNDHQSSHYAGEHRNDLVATSYLLTGFNRFLAVDKSQHTKIAWKIFGRDTVAEAVTRLSEALVQLGYRSMCSKPHLLCVLSYIFLLNRSPRLEDITFERLTTWSLEQTATYYVQGLSQISCGLFGLGIIGHPLPHQLGTIRQRRILAEVPPEWAAWCKRWRETTTCAPGSLNRHYSLVLQAGRWLARTHPDITSPTQWTRELAADYIAAVLQLRVGDWASECFRDTAGKPLTPISKANHITSMGVFFRDCQEWEWLSVRFDPRRCFKVPRSVRALIRPNPRVIADDIWAKLVWAGLAFDIDDLPVHRLTETAETPGFHYPLAMVRAVLITWLFAGLRSDELYRLRVGCIREQSDTQPSQPLVCLLDVPTNKTSTAFTKPVDRAVGEAIAAWEAVRPASPRSLDAKTGEEVHFLFMYRGRRIGKAYINQTLIPLLCRKAGVPEQDARGSITSHRARATIASQLFNAKEPMSLFELQAWLGHSSPESTQHYAKLTPTRLAKSFADADYFRRNLRMVDVLIDQEAIRSGAAAAGEPWRFYDLGHGYCTYDFFDQCPHRMACAKCAFYRPKGSTQAQLLEAKANLLRMVQEIPLTDEERAAVDDGITAVDHLCAKLADVPTPSGQTPRQLGRIVASSAFIPVESIGNSTAQADTDAI